MAYPSSLHPDTQLRRRPGADALTEAGYPTAPATLARKASVGGGPPFRKYGRYPLYRWADLLEWAESRMGPLVTTTSEADVADQRDPVGTLPSMEQHQRTGRLRPKNADDGVSEQPQRTRPEQPQRTRRRPLKMQVRHERHR
jgi:hypothetical protein